MESILPFRQLEATPHLAWEFSSLAFLEPLSTPFSLCELFIERGAAPNFLRKDIELFDISLD